MIKIPTVAFRKLIDCVLAKVFNERLNEEQQEQQKISSFNLLTFEEPGVGGINFYDVIFPKDQFKTRSPRDYFLRKYRDNSPDNVLNIPIKACDLIALLEYLESTKRSYSNSNALAEQLRDQFINKYAKEISKEYEKVRPTLLEFDASLLSLNGDKANKSISEFTPTDVDTDVEAPLTDEKKNNEVEEEKKLMIEDFLIDYFSALTANDYVSAIEFWHPLARHKHFRGNYENLAATHLKTVPHDDWDKQIEIFNYKVSEYNRLFRNNSYKCYVQFDEYVEYPYSKDIHVLHYLSTSDFEEVAKYLKTLKKRDGNFFKDIFERDSVFAYRVKLKELFSTECFEKMLKDGEEKIPYSIKEIFKEVRISKVHRLYEIECGAINDKWYLCDLTPIHSHEVLYDVRFDPRYSGGGKGLAS